MSAIQSFRDLDVYRLSVNESKKVFSLMMTFPREETYSLTDQIRRSPRAVGSMIAEAWAKAAISRGLCGKAD